jgi:hypothetical protein
MSIAFFFGKAFVRGREQKCRFRPSFALSPTPSLASVPPVRLVLHHSITTPVTGWFSPSYVFACRLISRFVNFNFSWGGVYSPDPT